MSQLTTIFEVQALITKGKGEQEKPFLEVKVEIFYCYNCGVVRF